MTMYQALAKEYPQRRVEAVKKATASISAAAIARERKTAEKRRDKILQGHLANSSSLNAADLVRCQHLLRYGILERSPAAFNELEQMMQAEGGVSLPMIIGTHCTNL